MIKSCEDEALDGVDRCGIDLSAPVTQLDIRVCCGKDIAQQNLILQILSNTEQFELKLHQVLGEPVSPLWNQGINLRSILPSYHLFLSLPSSLVSSIQEIFDWTICPKLNIAGPSHLSWQVPLVIWGEILSYSPQALFRVSLLSDPDFARAKLCGESRWFLLVLLAPSGALVVIMV